MRVLSLTCKHVNCYVIESGKGWIMVDAGWPDTLPQIMKDLKQHNLRAGDIKYLIVTHFHPDHAGLVQEFKDSGTKLILHEIQIPFIEQLNNFFKKDKKFNYKDISHAGNLVVSSDDSRELLKSLGLEGEIIHTPGHTEDSVTLVIDQNCAFTGDLPEASLVEAYDDQVMKDSWKLIRSYKVRKIYPAHGKPYSLE